MTHLFTRLYTANKEERFGFVRLPAKKGVLERIKKPGRLLPLQILLYSLSFQV